ncbi:uncharacterized protein LOC131888256 isoform X2 [Tigriopus californicus]|uniref:uncharacterized protein LOC131888256 isoform X2 n=1 Tax=Tigriopus californicus TaxID=6832 RepID=UPI0027DAA4B9|nr:uncharacterized protein LOC131888256 isoform X2 [Tigriopus californicus]
MFGAAAVRNKKRKQNSVDKADIPRGPYIKPFGPRFDPNELPYFKYKRALAEAKELQQNISRAKKTKQAAAKLTLVTAKVPGATDKDSKGGDTTPDALQGRMKIPQDGLGTAFPGRQGPPRGPRQKKIEENHAKYRKHKKIEQLDGEDGIYRASSSANVILYVGLGMLAIGLVITFVGLGDKGFKTLELKLIGPSLVGCGVFFCLLRILFCTVPSCCSSCVKCCKKSDDKKALIEQKDDKTASNSGAVNGNGVGNSNGTSFPTESRRRVAPSSSQKNRTHPNFIDETSSEEAKTKNSQKQNFRQKEIRSAHRETESLKQEVFAKEPEGENGPSSSFRSDRQIHTAKPLSYDNYSSSGSSEFSFAATSAEIVKAEGSNLSSMEVPKDSFVNKLANNAHYPDFNTIPQFPNLKGTNQSDESVEAAESGSGSAQKSEEDSVNLADPQLEVLMNPANLQA